MAEIRLGVIMYGVTGRMGTNQHLVRSILEIRRQGGVRLASGDRVMPDPILVGRNAAKLEALAATHGIERWTTDLDAALDNNQKRQTLAHHITKFLVIFEIDVFLDLLGDFRQYSQIRNPFTEQLQKGLGIFFYIFSHIQR